MSIKRLSRLNEGKRIRVEEGVLHIVDSRYGSAYVYDLSGQLACYLDIHPGDQTVGLHAGVYIVVLNGYPYKVKM